MSKALMAAIGSRSHSCLEQLISASQQPRNVPKLIDAMSLERILTVLLLRIPCVFARVFATESSSFHTRARIWKYATFLPRRKAPAAARITMERVGALYHRRKICCREIIAEK